jgi:hypothetical protein
MSDDTDFDALFDDEPQSAPTPRRRVKATYPEVKEDTPVEDADMYAFYQSAEGQRQIRMASTGRGHAVDEKKFYMPVGVSFLAKVLRLNAETVQRRLRTVTPVGHAGTSQNRPLYDFASVVPYLVKPKMDIRTYLRSLNPADMPQNISKTFWEAERIRTKALIEAGEAWPTDKVLQVMGQVFMMIKDRIPLITEGMREEGITDDQMQKLQAACDQFQKDLHEALVELPKQQATPPHLANVAVGVEDDGSAEE